jgi:hypothetical protein
MNTASIGVNVSVTEVGAGAVVANVVLPFCSASRTGGVVLINNGQAVYSVSAGAGGIGINDASSPALAAISFGFGKVT